MDKSNRENEKLLAKLGKIAKELNNYEMRHKKIEDLIKKVKHLLQKISTDEKLISLCKNPKIKIEDISRSPGRIGKIIGEKLKNDEMDNIIIRRNFYILCFRMAAIVKGKDVRRGPKYKWNPKNGKRSTEVAEALGMEGRDLDNLNYPLALSDYMLWYPGMVRTTSYRNVLKSGECSFGDLEDDLIRFDELDSNGNTVGLSSFALAAFARA